MAATNRGFIDSLPLVRPLDEEQARLVEILAAARGSEVSFDELRRRGIENPAVLAYELEIAGLPIAHVQRQRAGGRPSVVGLRLDATQPLEVPPSERPRHPQPPTASAAAGAAGATGAARADRAAKVGPRGRPAAPPAPRPPRDFASWIATGVAVLVLLIIVVALASGTGSGSGTGRHSTGALSGANGNQSGSSPAAAKPSVQPATPARHKASRHTHTAPTPPPPPPLSRAAQLQQSGHLLLAEGRYAAAISELRASLSAGGESATNCSEPTTPGCLAYAETLYDLGRALRLDNANAAAGAVLRERARINSQRSAVQHEIALNRRHRSGTPTGGHPPHPVKPHKTTKPSQPPTPAPHPHPLTGGAAAPAT